MAVANITEIASRYNRLVFATDLYQRTLSSPPKKQSFNSDQEITDIILEADELLCLDIRNTIGHEWAPTFFALSAALQNGAPIPAMDAPVHKVTWSTAADGTYQDSEVSYKNDIIEAIKNPLRFGEQVSDIYGYHEIVASVLYSTSPYTKVTQCPWTRTAVCQSPQSYTTGVLAGALALTPKEGLDSGLITFAEKKFEEFRAMVRARAMILPEIVEWEESR